MLNPKNILVRMPNWIGDLVMASPVLLDLRKAFPNAKLTAMALSPFSDLLEHMPALDEIFSFSRSGGFVRRIGRRDIVQKIKAGTYDLGVLLPNSFSSAWWFWQGKVTCRVGFKAHGRSPLLTHPLPFPENRKKQHLVRTYKELLRPLGIPISETPPELFVSDTDLDSSDEILKRFGIGREKTIIGINPGASYGSAKCWPPERFQEVAKKLLENKEVAILFFGNQTCSEMVKGICSKLPESAVDLTGATSLRQLMGLIKSCNVLLTNDSGPMHIADSLGVPVVALFGSTDPVVTGPYRDGIVMQKKVSCSPCFKRICPIDFRCMRQIEVEEVLQRIENKLRVSC